MNSPNRPGFIPPHGNYQKLLSNQKAEVIYDLTFNFFERFLKCHAISQRAGAFITRTFLRRIYDDTLNIVTVTPVPSSSSVRDFERL